MNESNVLRSVWLGLAGLSTVFRVNTGKAWAGKGDRMTDGSVRIQFAQPVALGLSFPNGQPVRGTSDLLGWTSVEVTPDMVGKRVALFTAVEVKESGGGRISADQTNFIEQVNKAGGIAFVASSAEAAKITVRQRVQPPTIE